MADDHDDQQDDAAPKQEGGDQQSGKDSEQQSGGDKQDGADEKDGNDRKEGDDKKGKGSDEEQEEKKPKAKWPWIVAGLVVLVFVIVVLILVLVPHQNVKTEDAYVTAHYTLVAPRVGGQVASVAVRDNQPVRAGQLLITLDPRDLQTALGQAEATREVDRARVLQADAQVARQPAIITQAAAQVVSARARLALAVADQRRYAALADTGAGTYQQHQQADAAYRQAQAALAQAEAELNSQRHQLDSLIADRTAAAAQVGQADAAVAQAKLNLSYTRIFAPINGIVGQKTVQVGNQVAPGGPIMALIPLADAYVVANYRELELRHMRPGQHAVIHLDAYDVDLDGYVQSIAPASGATFSPIPPNNATGNFTKIVQRLPVKIILAPHQPLARLLRAGLSVVVTVDTNLDDVVGAVCRNGRVDRDHDGRADPLPDRDGDGRPDRVSDRECAKRLDDR